MSQPIPDPNPQAEPRPMGVRRTADVLDSLPERATAGEIRDALLDQSAQRLIAYERERDYAAALAAENDRLRDQLAEYAHERGRLSAQVAGLEERLSEMTRRAEVLEEQRDELAASEHQHRVWLRNVIEQLDECDEAVPCDTCRGTGYDLGAVDEMLTPDHYRETHSEREGEQAAVDDYIDAYGECPPVCPADDCFNGTNVASPHLPVSR